ncbi:glycosyltransferase [Winogradskyella pulchriflava]|uniref:Glycosyltransferase n=1 Tax=Winogradskyella pulchriflava TaxID=1110688 RepID=A0ABV6Q4B2_9FLAO
MIVTSVSIAVIILYLFLIGSLIYGFDKVEDFKLQDLEPRTKFTVIIPFRDEAKNLPKLLESISQLNYPKNLFEVILVDDESSDDSVKIIHSFITTKPIDLAQGDISILNNKRVSNAPKKDAITSAIQVSKYNWIITTDADCILPKYWLDAFDEMIQTKNPNCIVGPVKLNSINAFFNRFQTLDILSLQGATIGSFGIGKPFLCNGANFGYQKSVFKALNGFEGNTNIASGDDIFLMEKFKKLDKKKVVYLKTAQAIVTTNPVGNFLQLIQQRLRWASKTSQNPNVFSKCIGLTVFVANLFCVVVIPMVFLNVLPMRIALALLVIKFAIDFLLLFKASRFFKQETLLLSYIFSGVLYPFFSVYIVLLSFIKSYQWKGRTFKK